MLCFNELRPGGFMTLMTLKNRIKNPARVLFILSCIFPTLAWSAVGAQQSSSTIAQGFQADSKSSEIVAGSLVSIKTGSTKKVELATTASAPQLVGVVDENPLVAITGDKTELQVVLSGTTNTLVSDINGPIKAGDKITASPIAGVGMVARTSTQIVGTAQSSLKGGKSQTLSDQSNKQHTIHVGRIPIQVGIAYYQEPGSNFLPPFIQNLANSIAGRPVSVIRALLATILLLLSFLVASVLVYAAVRSAMTSLGRNPLAARVIRRGLYQASGAAIIVVAGSLLAVYLMLSL